MKHIVFRYRDEASKGKWQEQECVMRSVSECKKFYGLGVDCEYEILSVTDIEKRKEKRND